MITVSDIFAVIVIRNTHLNDAESYQSLISREEELHFMVYDNSPYSTAYINDRMVYINDPSNSGISKAYNTACKYAKSHGYSWLLCLDQDTTFPDGALDAYIHAVNSNPAMRMIVPQHILDNGLFLSPTKYRMKSSTLQTKVSTGEVSFKDAAPINSGIMVNIGSFIQAGGYDENVWLDFSDVCFIERFKKSNKSFYVMPNMICKQNFSAHEKDSSKVQTRFRIYLECARNYPCKSLPDRIGLTLSVLRPTLSHTLRERSMQYLKAFKDIYLGM